MKKLLMQVLGLSVIATGIFGACRSKGVDPINDPLLFRERLTSLKKGEVQYFTIDAATGGTILGNDGSKINFPPLSFLDASGAVITAGSVDISLLELYQAKDFMLHRSTTFTTDKELLQSGGQIVLEAMIGGNKVTNTGYSIFFNQQALTVDIDQPMALFNGAPILWTPAAIPEPNIGWVLDSIPEQTMPKFDESLGNYVYFFNGLSQLGWINCDYWWGTSDPKTDVNLQIAMDGFTKENSAIYYFAPSINSASEIFYFNTTTDIFSFQEEILPIGLQVKFIFFGVKYGVDYLYVSPLTTLTADFSLVITPETSSLAEIDAALSDL